MTVIRSETDITRSILCSMSRTVYRPRRVRMNAIMRVVSSGDSPLVGSSRRRTFGPLASATATSSRRWSPWESSRAFRAAWPARPTSPRAARTADSTSRNAETGRHRWKPGAWRAKAAVQTFWAAVSPGNKLFRWNDRARPGRGVGRPAGDGAPVEEDSGAGRGDLAGDEVEERGLAGAVRPEDGVERPGLHRQVHAVDRPEGSEGPGQPLGLEQRHARPTRPG